MPRGKKRINRGGRPRAEGVDRYPSGQITKADKAARKKAAELAAKAAEADNVAVGVAQRVKHLGVSEDVARSQSAPLVAFRWWKNGTIQENHYRASEAFCRLYHDYLRAIRTPGLPRASGGSVDVDPDGTDPDYVDWCKRKKAEWVGIRHELLLAGGLHFMAAKTIAIENHEVHTLTGDFRLAMNIVSRILLNGNERKAA